MNSFKKIINFLCFSLFCFSISVEAKKISSQEDNFQKLCAIIFYAKGSEAKVAKKFKKLLEDTKIDVNYQSEEETLLGYAVFKHRVEIMKILIKKGANPNPENGKISYLLKSIKFAEQETDETVINILLAAGANPDHASKFGITALSAASAQGIIKTVEILLAAGANPNILDHLGRTALIASLSLCMGEGYIEKKLEIVTALLKAGANPHIVDCFGNTALQLAENIKIDHIRVEIIKALKAAGA